MQQRLEPVMGETNAGAERQDGAAPREVHVHVHHRWGPDERILRSTLVWLGVAVAIVAILFAGLRWYQQHLVETTVEQVTRSTATITEQARRVAAEARERSARRRAERDAARRAADDAEAARIAAAFAEADRREAAWQAFYVRSEFCRSPDNRTTMECANEHLRAKKEFEQRWADGKIQ